jgi:cytochrome c
MQDRAVDRGAASNPTEVLEGHTAPIVALAVSPDRRDAGFGRLGTARRGCGRSAPAQSACWRAYAKRQWRGVTPDGKSLVDRRYDLTGAHLATRPMGRPDIITLPAPLNAVAVAPDGEIVTGGADGKVRFLSPGRQRKSARRRQARRRSLRSAISPDGAAWPAAGIGGTVNLIDRKTRSVAARWSGRGFRSGRSRSCLTA